MLCRQNLSVSDEQYVEKNTIPVSQHLEYTDLQN